MRDFAHRIVVYSAILGIPKIYLKLSHSEDAARILTENTPKDPHKDVPFRGRKITKI